MPPLRAGFLRDQFTLQTRTESVTPATGVITVVWATVATIWGRLVHKGEAQQLDADKGQPRRAYEALIRTRTDLTPRHRVLAGSRTLYLTGWNDAATDRDQMVLALVEGLDLAGAGETLSLYAGTDAPQLDGSALRSWAADSAGHQWILDDTASELVRRLFGGDTTAEVVAIAPIDSAAQIDQAVVVTAGRHQGQTFLIRGRQVAEELPGGAYLRLALERTAEVIP